MIPTEFKGKLFFYWDPQYRYTSIFVEELTHNHNYVFLGASDELNVKFEIANASASAVAAIDARIKKTRDDAAEVIARLQHQKAELQAIGHQEVEA
ncbi:MAG: hypothetical protein R3221_12625 [Spongiibacter sp.]|nr:hypothetical protein [Spongiibacter sp.]